MGNEQEAKKFSRGVANLKMKLKKKAKKEQPDQEIASVEASGILPQESE